MRLATSVFQGGDAVRLAHQAGRSLCVEHGLANRNSHGLVLEMRRNGADARLVVSDLKAGAADTAPADNAKAGRHVIRAVIRNATTSWDITAHRSAMLLSGTQTDKSRNLSAHALHACGPPRCVLQSDVAEARLLPRECPTVVGSQVDQSSRDGSGPHRAVMRDGSRDRNQPLWRVRHERLRLPPVQEPEHGGREPESEKR